MNRLFVNIKVDREERPDLDSIYMDAVQAMTGQGGWPMSIFLTPAGQPFYGGTYYPPEPRYGMPSFAQMLIAVSTSWRDRRGQIDQQAQRLTDALRRSALISLPAGTQGSDLSTELLDEAVQQLQQAFDDEEGGFGSQPKFPQPMTLDFIMSQYARTRDLDTLFMAELTLEKMAEGGIYDHLGGGFHRYSVDAVWLVPHFEKMLYDNAQLLRSYLHAWQITQQPRYRRVVDETIDYLLREMRSPAGGFYSTQDADSEGEEGKFFVWTPQEIAAVLDGQATAILADYYGVSARGNFEHKNILNVSRTPEQVAARFQLSRPQVAASLAASRPKLFAERAKRVAPARDDKILTEWNGLVIHALAECGVTLERADALQAAVDAANFVLQNMSQPDGKLFRSYKAATEQADANGQAKLNGYLEDYSSFIRALIALYEATFELRWLGEASRLTQIMLEQFGDEGNGGFFQTGVDHEQLVVRRKDLIDNAVPSGNSLAAEALLRLAVLTGNVTYRDHAARICLLMKEAMARQPTGFGRLLGALQTLLAPSQEIAIVGDPAQPETQALLQVVRSRYLPNTVVALKKPEAESILPLFEGRGLVNGKPAAYVCENYACQLPVTDAAALAELLEV